MQGIRGTRSLRHAEHFAGLAKLVENDQGIVPHNIFFIQAVLGVPAYGPAA